MSQEVSCEAVLGYAMKNAQNAGRVVDELAREMAGERFGKAVANVSRFNKSAQGAPASFKSDPDDSLMQDVRYAVSFYRRVMLQVQIGVLTRDHARMVVGLYAPKILGTMMALARAVGYLNVDDVFEFWRGMWA